MSEKQKTLVGVSAARNEWRAAGRDPFADIERIVESYIQAGYNIVMPSGHVINKAEREARALVEAELPS